MVFILKPNGYFLYETFLTNQALSAELNWLVNNNTLPMVKRMELSPVFSQTISNTAVFLETRVSNKEIELTKAYNLENNPKLFQIESTLAPIETELFLLEDRLMLGFDVNYYGTGSRQN